MLKVEWQEYLAIGVAEIDDQHRLLFDKFSALLAAYKKGRSSEEMNRLFSFLGSYVITHFADEERLMLKLGYPDSQRHRQLHQEFTQKIALLRERLLREGPSEALVTTLTLTINGWLIEHISRMDRAFGRFMQKAP